MKRFLINETAYASSNAAVMVKVTLARNVSVLDEGNKSCKSSGCSKTELLAMCHCCKLMLQSAHDYVNSPIRKNAAKVK